MFGQTSLYGMYVILGYVFIAFFVGGGYYLNGGGGSFWGDAFGFGLGWPLHMAQFITG
jgi:hypothetical protein